MGLNYEMKEYCDVLSFNPGLVATNLTKMKKGNPVTITSDRAADVCFRDLGYSSETHGAFRHEIDIGAVMPRFLMNKILFGLSKLIRWGMQK